MEPVILESWYEIPNLTPEQELCKSIIVTAMNDLLSANQERSRNARKWFTSNEVFYFSFVLCCDALGADHKVVREKLVKAVSRGECRKKRHKLV